MLSLLFFLGLSSVRLSFLPRSSTIPPIAFFDHSFISLNYTALRWNHYRHPTKFSDSETDWFVSRTKNSTLWKDPLNFKKTYSSKNIKLFIEKIKEVGIIIEPKVDGFACLLEYKNGHLTHAFTKHNKLSHRIMMSYINRLDCVPKKIKMNFSGLVRGELFVSRKAFQKINSERIKYGIKAYKDPLGVMVSSLLGQKENMSVDNNIQFFGYYMKYFKKKSYKQSQVDTHRYLRKLGFKSDLTPKFRIFKDTKKAMKYITDVSSRRCSCSAPIDGIVVKGLQPDSCMDLDLIKLHPSLAYGFKFKTQIQNTKVISIIPVIVDNIRIGVIANLEPKKFSNGRTIRKVYIANRKVALLLRKKDVIAVRFSGNIPVLKRILTHKRNKTILFQKN